MADNYDGAASSQNPYQPGSNRDWQLNHGNGDAAPPDQSDLAGQVPDGAAASAPPKIANPIGPAKLPQTQAPTSSPNAPATPVTATGGMPPYVPPTAPDRSIAPVAAMPTYQAQHLDTPQFSQFTAPDQSANDAQQSALMHSILANPQTLNPTVIAQLKEQQREQAMLMGQQDNASYAQGAVGRGTLDSGRTDAFRQQGNANLNNAILSGNRGVDINAAQTNRGDELAALNASEGLASGQLGRRTSAYGTTLTGQQAQAGAGLNTANFNTGQKQAQYSSEARANEDAFSRALAIAQQNAANYGQDSNLDFNYNALNQNGRLAALNAGG